MKPNHPNMSPIIIVNLVIIIINFRHKIEYHGNCVKPKAMTHVFESRPHVGLFSRYGHMHFYIHMRKCTCANIGLISITRIYNSFKSLRKS